MGDPILDKRGTEIDPMGSSISGAKEDFRRHGTTRLQYESVFQTALGDDYNPKNGPPSAKQNKRGVEDVLNRSPNPNDSVFNKAHERYKRLLPDTDEQLAEKIYGKLKGNGTLSPEDRAAQRAALVQLLEQSVEIPKRDAKGNEVIVNGKPVMISVTMNENRLGNVMPLIEKLAASDNPKVDIQKGIRALFPDEIQKIEDLINSKADPKQKFEDFRTALGFSDAQEGFTPWRYRLFHDTSFKLGTEQLTIDQITEKLAVDAGIVPPDPKAPPPAASLVQRMQTWTKELGAVVALDKFNTSLNQEKLFKILEEIEASRKKGDIINPDDLDVFFKNTPGSRGFPFVEAMNMLTQNGKGIEEDKRQLAIAMYYGKTK